MTRAVIEAGKFSCFEMDGRLGITMTQLIHKLKWIETDIKSMGFPWTVVELTDAGRIAL